MEKFDVLRMTHKMWERSSVFHVPSSESERRLSNGKVLSPNFQARSWNLHLELRTMYFSALRPYDDAQTLFDVKMNIEKPWLWIIDAARPKKREAKAAPHHRRTDGTAATPHKRRIEGPPLHFTLLNFALLQFVFTENTIYCVFVLRMFLMRVGIWSKKKIQRHHHPKEEGTPSPPTKEEEAENSTNPLDVQEEEEVRGRSSTTHKFSKNNEGKKNTTLENEVDLLSRLGMASVFVSVCFLSMFFKKPFFLKKTIIIFWTKKCSKVATCILLLRARVETRPIKQTYTIPDTKKIVFSKSETSK